MARASYTFVNSVPSLIQPLATLFPGPIVRARIPGAGDINHPIGQIWINPAGNDAYMLTSVVNNAAIWTLLT